jgi:hypothetical protein
MINILEVEQLIVDYDEDDFKLDNPQAKLAITINVSKEIACVIARIYHCASYVEILFAQKPTKISRLKNIYHRSLKASVDQVFGANQLKTSWSSGLLSRILLFCCWGDTTIRRNWNGYVHELAQTDLLLYARLWNSAKIATASKKLKCSLQKRNVKMLIFSSEITSLWICWRCKKRQHGGEAICMNTLWCLKVLGISS